MLLELLKDRFTTVAELEEWLECHGIAIDLRSGLPDDTEDDLFAPIDEFLASYGSESVQVEARRNSLDPKESIQVDFDHEERFVTVDEESFRSIDEYFADGWIRVKDVFVRRPFVPTKTKPLLNIPARIRLDDFLLSKHQRRILRKNSDLITAIEPHSITLDDFNLFELHSERLAVETDYTIYDVVPRSSLTKIKKVTVKDGDRRLAVSYLDVGSSEVANRVMLPLCHRSKEAISRTKQNCCKLLLKSRNISTYNKDSIVLAGSKPHFSPIFTA